MKKLYKVKLDKPIKKSKDPLAAQSIKGYLGWDGEILTYSRGEAVKKAAAFGGKIELETNPLYQELTFTVKVRFMDKTIKQEQIDIVASNIADAIQYQADSLGLAPDMSDTFTESFVVISEVTDEAIEVVMGK